MNINHKYTLFLIWMLTACNKPASQEEETPIKAKVSVDVASITKGVIEDKLTLFASTMYLNRNIVSAPIPAYITKVYVKLGESVKEGQLLFEMETKEARALGSDDILPEVSTNNFGKISITAPVSGVVNILDKQQIGDYVLEGTQLCVIIEKGSLAFAVNVPYEFTRFTKSGVKCTLLLPDEKEHSGSITGPLTTMNAADQTQTFLAKSNELLFLPENLIVKVLIDKGSGGESQILPKAAVLSDEMMEDFWVMLLLNDSLAVKVNVIPGVMNNVSAEILEPNFSEGDRFLISGNYGLPDTVSVKVNNVIPQ